MNAVLDKYSTSHRRALIDQMPTYTPAADAPLHQVAEALRNLAEAVPTKDE